MFRRVDDFSQGWAQESESTLKLLRTLTDDSLAQRATPTTRSLGELAWHLVGTLFEMPTAAGLSVETLPEDTPVPASAAEIAETYERAARRVGEAVAAEWTDEALTGEVEMYGERWSRGLTLAILVAHQTHHRGQMTVLMRLAGLRVPGVYGPAREEWEAMGLPAQV